MPALDLALGHGVIGSAADMIHVLAVEPFGEVSRDVARSVIGTVRRFVLRPSPSLSDEPIAEDDGELGPGLEPFAWRPFPLVGLAIENQI